MAFNYRGSRGIEGLRSPVEEGPTPHELESVMVAYSCEE